MIFDLVISEALDEIVNTFLKGETGLVTYLNQECSFIEQNLGLIR